ncbi:MAG TPA: signal peptidase II [Casimicrobiaceae bacterium]|nr:signal peptidase II [Casimicrobiaceae bacterium]
MTAPRRWWLWVLASIAVVAIDQATKFVIEAHFRPGEQQVITSFFSLLLAFNTGAAFSFMRDAEGSRYVLSAVAVAAAVVIVWLLRRGGNRSYCAGLALILGGALGNLWDRIELGHVVDFLLFHWRDWYYPAFNVADSAITVGAALLILDAFRRRGHDPDHHGRPSR